MRTGAVLPNEPRPLTDDELRSLHAIMTDDGLIVRAWDYTPIEAIRQVLSIDPHAWVVLRSRFNGRINTARWLATLIPAARHITTTTARLILGPVNEPNHPSSPYATQQQGPDAFAEAYRPLRSELRRIFPNTPTVSPNLAVHHHDLEWAAELAGTFAQDDFIAVNAYWQNDNHLDPNWGLRLAAWHQLHPNKQLLTLETGDSTPNRSPHDSAQRIHANLDAQAAAGVAGACVFILGGTRDWATIFHYPPEDWATMRPTTTKHDDDIPPDDDPGPWAPIGNWRVHDLRDTLPTAPGQTYPRREPQDITTLIIHHSATSPTVEPAAIARYHVESNGWPAIAYHFLVHADGRVDYVGDLTTIRFHAGPANKSGVGICLLGDFTHDPPPDPQLAATRQLVAEIQYQLGDFLPVIPHRTIVRTQCPGNTWRQWTDQVTVERPTE